MLKKISLIVLFTALVLPLKAQQLVEGITAVVGREIILKTEIEQYVQNYLIQNRIDARQNEQIIKGLIDQTLDLLIEQKLLLIKADEDTLTVDDGLLEQKTEERIRYLIEQVGSESELEKIFSAPIRKIRRDTKKSLKEQFLVEQVRGLKFRDTKISRFEVQDFYKQYRDSLPRLQETVDISHILMLVKPSDDALSSAYQKIQNILEQLKNGAAFEYLAEQYSDDKASARRGGDLGLISRGDFVPEFETAAFQLQDGELSEIVQSPFGFHIIQMVERRGERIRTRHILVQVTPTTEDEKRIVEELSELRKRVLEGENFPEIALQYSEDENVQKDKGNLGIFEAERLIIPQFKTEIAKLQPGEISEPFKTEFGYHIVRLNDRIPQRPLSLENDWHRIQEIGLNFKMEREYRKWIEELKENIPIEIRNIL